MCPIDNIRGSSCISVIMVVDLSCIFDNIIEFESFVRWNFLLIVSFRVTEEKFLLLLFSFYKILGHLFTHQFGKIDIFLSISKERYFPLSFLFVPLRIVDYLINLIGTHQYVKNRWKFFNLFFLVPYRIK